MKIKLGWLCDFASFLMLIHELIAFDDASGSGCSLGIACLFWLSAYRLTAESGKYGLRRFGEDGLLSS